VPKAVVEGLLAKKDWAGLEAYLRNQKWEGQDFVRLALTALALRNQDLKDSAQLKLQEATREASKRAETLVLLSQAIESWGWQTEADDLLQLAVKKFPNDRRAIQAVSLIYYSRGNTAALYELFNATLKANPSDAATKNNLAMMGLLLNKDLNRAHQLAGEACQSDPKNPAFVSTRAFSLHLQGKDAEARALLEKLPKAERETPGIALYYALALKGGGAIAEAQKFAAVIPAGREGQLLPEEKRLLEEVRKPQK
jgi:Flp pilus assembly protein TadD